MKFTFVHRIHQLAPVSALGTGWPGRRSSGCAESPQKAHVKEAADKLFGFQGHGLLLGVMTIILVTECHLVLRDVQETII
jgi:hypothetical protein